MKKNYILFPILLIGLILLIFVSRYFYMKYAFTQPYKIAGNVMQEALQDKSSSEYLLSEEQWNAALSRSVYKIVREPLQWNEFKEFIQKCERNEFSSLLYSDGKATYQVIKSSYADIHTSINIDCIDYSKENNEIIERNSVTLLLEKLDGSWKIVGKHRPLE
ncbi:hypothetical protein H1D32_12150 [Anaerobacillus sp. CMMVII]|uniref:hypothetical protein n=1 Tax=Anaerobacillus sp. CMMVII TaxID=2755588 RepID=UPI0021B77DBD|nr:hypothetical protein [Anaerobacillus sp. CMMVII]MCT8138429.1 hypothetical protein [Anaerobacillus sp. CMMVII]